jgi:hypothetical protein
MCYALDPGAAQASSSWPRTPSKTRRWIRVVAALCIKLLIILLASRHRDSKSAWPFPAI